MAENPTQMREEIEDIPAALGRLLDRSTSTIEKAGAQLRKLDPKVVCTVARGSSDHAATYLKYAIELTTGVPVASVGPSVSSIYGADLKLDNGACIGISQSGRSPDITHMIESAMRGGATTIAITNQIDSPMGRASSHAIDIQAGPEQSVAATKTFVTSIVSGLLLLGHWTRDKSLLASLIELPALSAQAISCDWDSLARRLLNEESLYVLGRGPAFAIAKEVALKFKETCRIQGEAFSSAEVLHGPVSIVGQHYPVLTLVARDRSLSSICDLADDLADRGADVFATTSRVKSARALPAIATGHPLTDPLMLIVPFYAMVESLARRRGLDPDRPRNLKKVTETV